MAKEEKTLEKSRTRNIQKKFWVTEEENELIKKRMELVGYNSFNEFMVRMAIDGFIILQDYSNFIAVSNLIHNIGVDINKIAHCCELKEFQEEKINSGEMQKEFDASISLEDIKKIDKHMENIWETLNKILKEQSGSSLREKRRIQLEKEIDNAKIKDK